ncbi:hypothetical protein [Candidatus Entotheonella palauensis]|uniref:Uncharacterized protein n=1 Tax=Candidatus Entotheonella gemina TaxID=1429439 RepID=W4L6H3_9BACT|nr:hypothetical protein [Candidatus Entotheonella palauensis]ETW93647.1 MAG: hypothetical protein ETSY2_51035 [Candidatus Entotheonella gemina]
MLLWNNSIDAVVAHQVLEHADGSVKWKLSLNVYFLEDHEHDMYNLIHMASQITAPTLLIYASESLIPREVIEAFGRALPHGQV